MAVRFRARPRSSSNVHCLYCKADLAGEVLTCDGCRAVYHHECVDEGLTNCPTLGCGARLRRSILDEPPVVFEAPQPPAWFWPAAVVGFFAVGLASVWTAHTLGESLTQLTLNGLGWTYVVVGSIGVLSWLHDHGVDLRQLCASSGCRF